MSLEKTQLQRFEEILKELEDKGHEDPFNTALGIFDEVWTESFSERGKGEPVSDCVGRKISILDDEHPSDWSHEKKIAVAHRMCGAPKPKGKK